jgi:hypothetical protein
MKYVKVLLLLLCLAPAAGCVREDAAECDRAVTIRFSYTGDGDTEIFGEKIDKVDLYVFDQNHRVVLSRSLTPDELAGQSAQVSLPPGKTYRAVSIGNAHNNVTASLHEGAVSDTKLMHPVTHPDIETGDRRVDSNDHLYHTAGDLTVSASEDTEHLLTFSAAHHDVVVEVAGYVDPAPVRADGDPGLYIEHLNLPAWTDFENNHSADEHLSHFPMGVVRDGVYVHEYNVMRHLDDSYIHVHSAEGDLLYELDVTAFLAEHPAIDPARHEDVLAIRIEFTSLHDVSVSIPEWAIKKTNPEY